MRSRLQLQQIQARTSSLIQLLYRYPAIRQNKQKEWDINGGVKRQRREAHHSTPASAEVKKMWIYTSTPPYAFFA
jgi:hypothetical protein